MGNSPDEKIPGKGDPEWIGDEMARDMLDSIADWFVAAQCMCSKCNSAEIVTIFAVKFQPPIVRKAAEVGDGTTAVLIAGVLNKFLAPEMEMKANLAKCEKAAKLLQDFMDRGHN